MSDIWAFLLQTLTASGVAVLLLAVKGMFRDKLPPRWQFAIWGVLGLTLAIPAGIGRRYVLFNWPLVVETLKSVLAGDYSDIWVLLPFPVPRMSVPGTILDGIFLIYVLGVLFHLLKYAVSYIRLRLVLRRGAEADAGLMGRIREIAAHHHISPVKVTAVAGLPSAFVCGVLRPILAIPADTRIDDKILLHELLHLKSRDTAWSIVICLLRSIHWCNPLLSYCADQALNDLEARCDQRVLELLEGEERRDYGRILLSMANDRYAGTPGATCISNGGKNIRRRIESIARFKRYPAGMHLVSVCAILILAFPMILGVEATEVFTLDRTVPPQVAFASARAVFCTTPAGAFDAYAKAILDQNGIYRAMCAPADMQKELTETVIDRYENGRVPYWEIGIDAWPNTQEGYYIYNLRQVSDTAYEALLVIKLNYRPDGRADTEGMENLAIQNLRVEKEGNRWVTIALDDLRWVETDEGLSWGSTDLPAFTYSGTAADVRVDVRLQTIYVVRNTIQETSDIHMFFGPNTDYHTMPKPNAEFSTETRMQFVSCTHLGSQTERDRITAMGVSVIPVMGSEQRPTLIEPDENTDHGGSSTDGEDWSNRTLKPGWGPMVDMNGGGISHTADLSKLALPEYYAADLYINGEMAAQLELRLQEGGSQ